LQEDGSFRELTFTLMVEHAAPSRIEHEPAIKTPYSAKSLT
jgi:hypothetical protein